MALRVVLDTNVLVSGLIGVGGPPRAIVDGWLAGSFVLVTSLYLIDELRHVLNYPRIAQRLHLRTAETAAIFTALSDRAEIVRDEPVLGGATRDPKDDAVLACAVAGAADLIVSGDQDLLVLGRYRDIPIITPQQFLTLLA